jgi:predicted dehydrogenase
MNKIKCGIIGMGYVSISHIEAVRRLGFVEIEAVADINFEMAQAKAKALYIPKCYRTEDELISDPAVEVIHNCTPNYLHRKINEKVLHSGKHIFSEKPLAKNTQETSELVALLGEHPNQVAGVNFNYRMNPLVQDMKDKINNGEIGRPRLIHGSYLQDWLLFETDYSWRLDAEISGLSNTIADIGSHWMDSVQVATGAKINAVCADLVTNVPKRKKPRGHVQAFAESSETEFETKIIDVEDYGAVLFRMDNGSHGVFHVSQVSAGRKCYLNFEINGEKASLQWNQENADQMWVGYRDEPNGLIIRNPNWMSEKTRHHTYLAAGHPEGWNDAMTNNVKSFYQFLISGKKLNQDHADFATFEEAHYIMRLVEAILESHRTQCWVHIEQ